MERSNVSLLNSTSKTLLQSFCFEPQMLQKQIFVNLPPSAPLSCRALRAGRDRRPNQPAGGATRQVLRLGFLL